MHFYFLLLMVLVNLVDVLKIYMNLIFNLIEKKTISNLTELKKISLTCPALPMRI